MPIFCTVNFYMKMTLNLSLERPFTVGLIKKATMAHFKPTVPLEKFWFKNL